MEKCWSKTKYSKIKGKRGKEIIGGSLKTENKLQQQWRCFFFFFLLLLYINWGYFCPIQFLIGKFNESHFPKSFLVGQEALGGGTNQWIHLQQHSDIICLFFYFFILQIIVFVSLSKPVQFSFFSFFCS